MTTPGENWVIVDTTVSDVLARELEDVASGRSEELSAAIPGFGAALEWLDGEQPQLPC